MSTNAMPTVRAAGCVVWRYGSDEPEVLVVHRPRWDDWSFPKGKLDAGETTDRGRGTRGRGGDGAAGQARRHGCATTTTRSRPGSRRSSPTGCASHRARADISALRAELGDRRGQVDLAVAGTGATQLPRDVELLDELTVTAFESSVLLRGATRGGAQASHLAGATTQNARWQPRVVRTAGRLVPVLAAYGVTRVVTSDAARCVETMLPFVNASGVKVRLEPGLSEEKVSDKVLARLAAKALHSDKRIAICTHRPVLPVCAPRWGSRRHRWLLVDCSSCTGLRARCCRWRSPRKPTGQNRCCHRRHHRYGRKKLSTK